MIAQLRTLLLAILTVPSMRIAAGLVLASSLVLLVEERRLAIAPLFIQYTLAALLIGSQVYRPLIAVRLGLGWATCLLLLVSAGHVQRRLAAMAADSLDGTEPDPVPRDCTANMGLPFRFLLVILGGLLSFGLTRAYTLPLVPLAVTFCAYWMASLGLLLILSSVDPLRIGFGLLMLLTGFESVYLVLEQSLLVIGLLGIVQILLAFAIASIAESWPRMPGTEETAA